MDPVMTWRVDVRLLPEPSLWCWEIREGAEERLVESSWTGSWLAFESREEAEAAGQRRLDELVAARRRHDTPETWEVGRLASRAS